MPVLRAALLVATVTAFAAAARAQADRYELGLRLRAFERHLAATTDPARRDAAFAAIDRAVQAFFSLDTAKVAVAIDSAEAALDAAKPTAEAALARSLGVQFAARLVDADAGTAAGTLARVYAVEAALPAGLTLRIAVPTAPKSPPFEAPVRELPMPVALPLALPPGDHVVHWSLRVGGTELVAREQGLSVVRERDRRLQALPTDDDDALRAGDLDRATLPALAHLLTGMTRRRAEETVLPGAALLERAEALRAAIAADRRYHDGAREGQFWLRVPVAGRAVTTRFVVPKPGSEPRPLVVALHGAGGSENLFCDGYGDGAIVKLCAERNWLLATPRVSPLGLDVAGLVDGLANRYPIDRRRVFVVGHSMGAAAAVAAGVQAPDRYAGIAALAGGGNLGRAERLRDLPFLVASGGRDFGHGMAKDLDTRLRAAGVPEQWLDYPGVDHLTIVQIALPDVFAFFDQQAAGRR